MSRWHSWIVPSKTNKFHPHILRPIGLAIIAVVLVFIPSFYNLTTRGSAGVLSYASNITIGDVHAISNAQRAANGVAGLNLNAQLNQAAAAKASHMFALNYWAHNGPDGTTPWMFISNSGYAYSTAGENLAKNFSTSSGVVTGWMNSPGHRDNMLKAAYTDVGYGVMNGVLLGEETTLVVAMYAAPVNAPAPAPAPTPAPAPAPVASAAPAPKPAPTAAAPTETTAAESEAPAAPTEEIPAKEEEIVVEEKQPTTAATTEPSTSPQEDQSIGAVAGAIITAPVTAYTGLNWGQKASLFILSVLALLFIMKHTLIWRSQKKGLRHIWLRSHPLAQASFLIVATVVTLLSGTGTIL